jgi:cell division protein FtsB
MEIDGRRLLKRSISGALFSVALYYALWGGEYTAFDLLRLGQQQKQEETRLERTRVEVDSLTALVRALESDPATIEAVARERFGMIREGEVLYRFVDVAEPGVR